MEYALPYIAFVHLKDVGDKLREWNFPPLGKGTLDFEKIREMIKEYSGPISVEIEFDGKERSLKEINNAVKESYKFLSEHGFI
jgi:sugar phosphate isomerase/epimerase